MENQKSIEREIELAFIARLLDDPSKEIPSAMDNRVEEDWFSEPRCRAVWRAAGKVWAHSESATSIDPMAVLEAAGNEILADPREFGSVQVGYEFYEEATRFAMSVGGTESLVESLQNAAMTRRMRDAFTASDKIIAEGGSASDAVGELARKVADIQAMKIAATDEGCHDLVMKNIEAWRHARHEVVDNHNADFVLGLPVPWSVLSKKIRGLQVGMHVIAARPSVGKTSFGMQIALSLVNAGFHVGFNSLDMPVQQLMKRPVASVAQVPLEPLDNGYATEETFAKVEAAAAKISGWQRDGLFQITQKFNVYDFSSWCAVKKAEGRLDIVFVDYIQKMNAGRKLTGEAAMKEVSSVTSTIAKKLNIPVVALAQLNRSNEKDSDGGEREPKISDIRESGSIEQDAFTIMLLYNDPGVKSIWKDTPPVMMDPLCDYERGHSLKPVWVNLAKNQNGRTCRFPFVVYENTFTWYLGDWAAEKETGVGANIKKFSRITPDGRNPELEHLLGAAGYLVGQDAGTKPPSASADTTGFGQSGSRVIEDDRPADDFSAIDSDFDPAF